jgi:hypothetical protein
MRAHERIKEVEKDSWTCCGTKKRHGQAGAGAVDRRRDVAASGDGGAAWNARDKTAGRR